MDLQDENVSNISDLINTYNVTLVNGKMDMYDIVSTFLENSQSEEPFFVVNIGDVIRQYQKWIMYLPMIKPYYAVKCNPDPLIIKVLHRLGCGFDCASKNEINKALDLGASPDEIIFANPCKLSNMIKFARAHDVDRMTFDCEHELYKIKLYHSGAKLVLRIVTDDKESMCGFSCKFGATVKEGERLMKFAKELKLNIIGISFHVGSGCGNPNAFKTAIADARKLFDYGKTIGYNMTLLDIGGGYPGKDDEKITFERIATNIKEALDASFKDYPGLQIISEPGRYFVSKSHTLVTSIMNKKYKEDPGPEDVEIVYYLNDGVYSSFFNIPMDSFVVKDTNTFPFNERNEKKYRCKIWGPTCDSLDLVSPMIMLPDLEVGEYLITTDMGAYTVAVTPGNESFNGFNKTQIKYMIN